MKYEDFYTRIKELIESGDYTGFGQGIYSYEFHITGEGEGVFYIEIRDGQPDMQPYDYKDSLCTVTADSEILLNIVEGRLSPIDAYSSGRLTFRGDVSSVFFLADALALLQKD